MHSFRSLFILIINIICFIWPKLYLYHPATAKSLQSCPTLCDPIDGSPPGSHIPGSLQARTLEWAAISFSNVWKWKVKVKSLSRVLLLATPWTAAYQAPPSMGFSRQGYWSGVPLPSPFIILLYHKFFNTTGLKSQGNVRMFTRRCSDDHRTLLWPSREACGQLTATF